MRGSWLLAFVPVACFLACCVALFVHYKAFDMVGLAAFGFVSLLIGAVFARRYASYWEAVMRGIASPTAVSIVVILFVIGIFSELVKVADLSSGFVWLGDALGLGAGLVPFFTFLTVCVVAMSTGSSIGTMFTAFPIFYPAGVALGADPALMAGAILSGAIFGDNLAPISDTTIISASTQSFRKKVGQADIAGVVRSRAKYSLTAAGFSSILFIAIGVFSTSTTAGASLSIPDTSPKTLVMLVPVGLMMLTSFVTRDIFKAISVGLLAGTLVGLATGILVPTDIVSVQDGALTGFVSAGVHNIIGTVALVIAVFGIMGVLTEAGVLTRTIGALQRARWAHTPGGSEASIALGISLTTVMFGGVNSASMMTFGPVADQIGADTNLHPYRRCNVMDSFAMGAACVVPFLSAFLFIGSLLTSGYEGVPSLSAVALFPTVFYPLALTLVMVFAIATGWGRRFEGPGGAEERDPVVAARVETAAAK
ncbi:MAG TPA: Na+/H+ antiporter NhaC family protein [Nocardioides sp.]|uniref:Na+/H+ antiporter NhaC family protein n=1 Tax=Nocardioides sp. TaxID=35761 RepID=UPI002BA4A4F4|nr:Na+/H+ antiporter NhaC family protein [Nocardioides sp.]HQR25527.1 Na+/H+ antiporter NhaC family protein [Nocardioides sp.]